MIGEDAGRLAYSREELREKLGIGLNAIDRAIRDGALRSVRIGRRVVIPADEVRRFLEGAR
ncbi:MAG: helix-turn-helix domain-containing protein [Candidatus Baltobacteraceae bacterium]